MNIGKYLRYPEQRAAFGIALVVVIIYLIFGIFSLPRDHGNQGIDIGINTAQPDSARDDKIAKVAFANVPLSSFTTVFGLIARPTASLTEKVFATTASSAVVSEVASKPAFVTKKSAVQPGDSTPASATKTVQKPDNIDLKRIGYKLKGIIHDSYGKSAVFLWDPDKKRETVVVEGASDTVQIIKVSDRFVDIETPKGRGRLALYDPLVATGVAEVSPVVSSIGNSPTANQADTLKPTSLPASAAAVVPRNANPWSSFMKTQNSTFPPPNNAPQPAPALSRDKVIEMLKSNILKPKVEQGRWTIQVENINANSPLAHFGVQQGDQIIAVGDHGFSNQFQIPAQMGRLGNSVQDVTILRQGKMMHLLPGKFPTTENSGADSTSVKPSASAQIPVAPNRPSVSPYQRK